MTGLASRTSSRAARRYKTKEDPRPCDGCEFSKECSVVLLRCQRFIHWADTGTNNESKPLAVSAHNMQLKLDNVVRN